MTSARKRGAVGTVGAAFWLVGTTAAAPLADTHPLFGLAQVVIDASPGWVATTVINTFGKSAQPLVVAGIGAAVLVAGMGLGLGWPRLPAGLRNRPVASGSGLVVATAGTFFVAGVTSLPTLVGVTALGAAPALAFAALAARGGVRPAEGGAVGDRRSVLQGVGVAAAGAVGVGALTRTVVPAPEAGTAEPEPLPPSPDAEGGAGSDTPTPDARGTATPKRDQGRTVTARPTATVTPTPDVVREETIDEITITEVEGAGSFGFDFAGMPEPVTPVGAHYVVDKAVDNPEIDSAEWTLSIGGAVDEPYDLAFDDLTGHEASRDQVVTMLCISNEVGGGLISTGRWRGIPLKTLVEQAGPADDVVDVVTKSPDGYSEGIPWDYVRDHPEVVLAYGLNGKTLTTDHGAPARLLIPGRYGMKSTKWVTDIELQTSDHEGYWERRGWSEKAVINMTSYIRAVQRRGDRVAVGGIAYAGLDGVQAVETSLDGGETWTAVELEDPPGEYAWRRWRHVVERPPGTVDIVTRVIDGTGQQQTSERRPAHFGGGATGWHQQSVEI